MRVCVFTCTACKQTADTRVFKEARTLWEAVFNVQIIGCLDSNTSHFEDIDSLEIYRAVEYILADQARYNRMRENALVAARQYTGENEPQKLLDIYRKLSNG